VNESEPDRRAAKQRKQQVQIEMTIHDNNIADLLCFVIRKLFAGRRKWLHRPTQKEGKIARPIIFA
jgi:hypothetical protein